MKIIKRSYIHDFFWDRYDKVRSYFVIMMFPQVAGFIWFFNHLENKKVFLKFLPNDYYFENVLDILKYLFVIPFCFIGLAILYFIVHELIHYLCFAFQSNKARLEIRCNYWGVRPLGLTTRPVYLFSLLAPLIFLTTASVLTIVFTNNKIVICLCKFVLVCNISSILDICNFIRVLVYSSKGELIFKGIHSISKENVYTIGDVAEYKMGVGSYRDLRPSGFHHREY